MRTKVNKPFTFYPIGGFTHSEVYRSLSKLSLPEREGVAEALAKHAHRFYIDLGDLSNLHVLVDELLNWYVRAICIEPTNYGFLITLSFDRVVHRYINS